MTGFNALLSGVPAGLSRTSQGLWQVLTAKSDAKRVEPLPIKGPRQQQDSCLLDEVGAEFINRPLKQRRKRDGSCPRSIPAKQLLMRAEESVETDPGCRG